MTVPPPRAANLVAHERRPLIVGNWKLHNTVAASAQLARSVATRAEGLPAEIAVAPVFTALHAVGEILRGTTVALAAQDVFWEPQGAFTGEVSVQQLADVGCTYVIVGHSERRQHFGETDATVNRKVKALLAGGLRPIVCVGESLAEREAGHALSRVDQQVRADLTGLSPSEMATVVIAYEPIWAIGTGRTALPTDAQEVHASLRAALGQVFGAIVAGQTRILYGGSVAEANAASLLVQPDVDGALVGGASLSADQFLAIAHAAG
jgi:triosephosphate isomerase